MKDYKIDQMYWHHNKRIAKTELDVAELRRGLYAQLTAILTLAILFLFLGLSGCATVGRHRPPSALPPYDLDDIDRAVFIVEDEFKARGFGDLAFIRTNLRIVWLTDFMEATEEVTEGVYQKTVYDGETECKGDGCVLYVTIKPEIYTTSLIHELVHAYMILGLGIQTVNVDDNRDGHDDGFFCAPYQNCLESRAERAYYDALRNTGG